MTQIQGFRTKGTRSFLFALAALIVLAAGTAHAQLKESKLDPGNPEFKIDPNTPVSELLPPAPLPTPVTSPWLVKDLGQVPLLLLQRPEAIGKVAKVAPKTRQERDQAEQKMAAEIAEEDARIAHQIAKIKHLNLKDADEFVKILRDKRDDLTGLPFTLGAACRTSKERSSAFVLAVAMVRDSLAAEDKGSDRASEAKKFWIAYTVRTIWDKERVAKDPQTTPARVAALMQMLAPKDKAYREGLVKHLSEIDHPEATRALARLAVFSFEDEVRKPALAALKMRSKNDYAEVLVAGLRYPWPAVVQNAGDAIVALACKDLVPQLVALLDEPDPRAPTEIVLHGKKTQAVRELVRVNHHRSCLMCHAPGNDFPGISSGNLKGLPDPVDPGIVLGAVPNASLPLSPPSQGYDPFRSPDLVVRVDVTYLRQDFSMLQPVKDADPWPTMQRFDFLVRARPVPAEEAAAYQTWLKAQGPGYLAPHQNAALAALRALTGRDADPTSKAWRHVLAQ